MKNHLLEIAEVDMAQETRVAIYIDGRSHSPRL